MSFIVLNSMTLGSPSSGSPKLHLIVYSLLTNTSLLILHYLHDDDKH